MYHFSKFVFASMFATSASGLAFQKATQQGEKFNEVSVILAQSSTLEDMTNIFKSSMVEAILGRKFLKPNAKKMNFVHSIVHLKNPAGNSVFCQLKGSDFVCDDTNTDDTPNGFKVVDTRSVGAMKKALTRREINDNALAVQKFFKQNGSYDLLSNNCNTTAEEFVRNLTGGSIGKDVTDPIAVYVLDDMQAGIRQLMDSPLAKNVINIHRNPVEAEKPKKLRRTAATRPSHHEKAQMRHQNSTPIKFQQATTALHQGLVEEAQNILEGTNPLEAADEILQTLLAGVETNPALLQQAAEMLANAHYGNAAFVDGFPRGPSPQTLLAAY